MYPIIVDQTCTTVRRDFAHFGSAVFLWHLVRIALLGSCQSISFGLRSALWRGRSRRCIFLLLKPIYCCALGHCHVASLSLSWASYGRQTNLHSLTKYLNYLSDILYSQHEVVMLVLYALFSTDCFLLVSSVHRTFCQWRWGTSRCSIAQTDVFLSIWYSHYVFLCTVPTSVPCCTTISTKCNSWFRN